MVILLYLAIHPLIYFLFGVEILWNKKDKHLIPNCEIGDLQHLGLGWRLKVEFRCLSTTAIISYLPRYSLIYFLFGVEIIWNKKGKYFKLNCEIINTQYLGSGWRLKVEHLNNMLIILYLPRYLLIYFLFSLEILWNKKGKPLETQLWNL